MSKGLNKILGFMKLNDEEYDDDFDEFAEAEAQEPPKESRKRKASKSTTKKTRTKAQKSYEDIDDDDTYDQPKKTNFSRSRRSKIVPMNSSRSYAGSIMEVRVSRPVDFESCQEISDIILENHAAVINFEAVTPAEAQRIIDFVSGSCYAIDGTVKQISENIVVVTPNDIDITGDFPEDEDTGSSSSGYADDNYDDY